MPFAYYDRLSPARKATYRRSDAIGELPLPAGASLGATVVAIRDALAAGRRAALQRACQALCDALTAGYRVPPVRVVVLERRPSDDYGELHGLYEPAERGRRARITAWMRTAARQQVVAFRSFLRTLVHELGHHLDYELFALEETFHTEGFYKRESGLANALFAQADGAGQPPPG
ncbi:MAG: hypothetical protein BroJett026_14850 [Betaproteobacteria bacterium]|nr:MAG: hypothetical protein BroJett026_14850 [Betaproteobacteria bacterium]